MAVVTFNDTERVARLLMGRFGAGPRSYLKAANAASVYSNCHVLLRIGIHRGSMVE